ncbi:dihydroneopterin aldolase [Peribacillus psychrosaccharolyticus]|uniref:7,8-dihydroneopterin aldolase n=1 Tax=Peribacillus psychrosaccharolyticus TaxID=1407 RepID=A0A974NIZ2_PERPY|nr:dihydroneopterin aldolase [Peribacillus psychrosaccharolyticus]MEC2058034.1 dihydroneopterin aldolase [Peribacillus psychrosaccharolyticus]MED3746107.1 dihydroneopterin aldolase [Peribacillus psychrosaccharolyticus]QQS98805.1 dihydroneopterin aldolase [Peribacillus psychrosaccharolyticus]
MDKIFVNQMEFYGYHGVFPEENRLGQRFVVDLIIETDLSAAGKSDQLDDSINYGELYAVCKEVVEGEQYNLVEAIAEQIASRMLTQFSNVQTCTVKVFKPDPPIPGHYKSVAVEIKRGR